MTSELNQWDKALAEGKLAEAAFGIMLFKHLGIKVSANNAVNVKAVDCACEFIADVKVLQSPYPSAKTPSGLDKDEHLTLDVANIDKYHEDTLLCMVVDYTKGGVETSGFYLITVRRVREIMKAHPERVYTRSARSSKDKSVKVGISTNECCQMRFGDMTGRETGDAFMNMIEVLRDRATRLKEAS